MGIKVINGHLLRKMIIAGANELDKNRELIDSLNVFPVPDGDTGSNMANTTISAAKEVEKITEGSKNSNLVSEIAKVASAGALLGARGNSGVILSQLFRGFAKGLEGKNEMDADSLALAVKKASEMAYKAVMKPKEGTVLTVARMVSEKVCQLADETDDLNIILTESLAYSYKVLNMTKEMLPQLKQANVVDAGGKGLIAILQGAVDAFNGKAEAVTVIDPTEVRKLDNVALSTIHTEDITFGYCTEFFIIATKPISEFESTTLTDFYSTIGDSLVVVADENILKIHVHTNNPGKVLERALELGSLSRIKIDNMREQHTSKISFDVPADHVSFAAEPAEIGFLAVSAGSGLTEFFKELGANEVIEGGQTMNPSTEDILQALKKINAKNIIVLPNNKNIVLAAELAASLINDKKIYPLSTNSIPQGISALVVYRPDLDIEQNIVNMKSAIKSIKSGQVTLAVRDTTINDTPIAEGDSLGILEGSIVVVTKNRQNAAKELLQKMVTEHSSLVTIFYGEDVTEEEAQELEACIQNDFDWVDFEIHNGQQPVYHYIISVE